MRTSVADIVRETAAKHGLSVQLLLAPSHKRAFAWPRQEAMYRVFTECEHISLPEAGRRLGGRDHTTVLHGIRRHCERIGVSYENAKEIRFGRHPGNFDAAVAAYGKVMSESYAYLI